MYRLKTQWEIKTIKILLGSYILFCFIIAGLNYGYAANAEEKVQKTIQLIWHIYENEFKTCLIIVCSILTLRIISKNQRVNKRKMNLLGIAISAIAVHVVIPRIIGNSELYLFSMPLPWTTTQWKIMDKTSPFYISSASHWGVSEIMYIIAFFIILNIIVIIGTLIMGRRWQCSTICLFNGFASEVFSPIFPLFGKKGKPNKVLLKTLNIMRGIFLFIALFYTLYWILRVNGINILQSIDGIVYKLETYKYLFLELILAMVFWMVSIGRGYCYYCPAGTILGFIGKFAGQKIDTSKSKCVKCGKCDVACPMGIEIQEKASLAEPIKNTRCVGCCHCVDACPTKNLEYSTKALEIIKSYECSLEKKNKNF